MIKNEKSRTACRKIDLVANNLSKIIQYIETNTTIRLVLANKENMRPHCLAGRQPEACGLKKLQNLVMEKRWWP